MLADGSNGSIEIAGDSIIIRRKGFANILTQGVQGDKQIPIKNITSIQFKSAGGMMAGLIQFSILGGREFRGGMLEATKDENAVMFSREQEPAFLELREMIQRRMNHPERSATMPTVEELERLAALHEKGLLTAEEFSEAKRGMLSGSMTSKSSEAYPIPQPAPPPPATMSTAQGCLRAILIFFGLMFGFLVLVGIFSHR